ncbi:MAG TPA: DUF2283 domain-containing protein [Blastocatellia bacterium]
MPRLMSKVLGRWLGELPLNKMRIRYFEQEDVLHLAITEEPESRSLELSPGITVELNDKDEMIGVEILNASKFLRDAVLESIQAKTLRMLEAEAA